MASMVASPPGMEARGKYLLFFRPLCGPYPVGNLVDGLASLARCVLARASSHENNNTYNKGASFINTTDAHAHRARLRPVLLHYPPQQWPALSNRAAARRRRALRHRRGPGASVAHHARCRLRMRRRSRNFKAVVARPRPGSTTTAWQPPAAPARHLQHPPVLVRRRRQR